jgi:beta-lactamase regulating signal transducer with metallopeptidase domain
MKTIFELFLSASFFGSVMILLVVAARFVLRKAPRGIFCLLWVLVGLRLLIPFRIESNLSLQPSLEAVTPAPTVAVQPQQTPAPVPAIPEDVAAPDVLPGDVVINYDNDAVSVPVQRQIDYMEVTAWVWAVGVVAMAGYTVVTYMLLKRKLKDAAPVGEDVYESDAIDSPFLLGYVKPAVYLPKGISDEDRPYILAHERCHMDRFDNWFKLAGFLCVGLHWFNPLVWLGYHLLCRDIEMACDEAVVRHMDLNSRKGYSAALVSCSTERKFGACPVAFGEVSVKQRVLSVLNYRKPGFWISLACVAVIGFTVVCFMTTPADHPKEPTVETLPTEPAGEGLLTERDRFARLCKDIIESIQNADSYHYAVQFQTSDPASLLATSMEYFWYSDGNYLAYDSTRDWENQYLLVDGKYFRRDVTIAVPPEDIPYPNWTEVVPDGRNFLGKAWLMELDWDASQPELVASTEENGQRIATFSMVDPEVGNGYMLTFVFDLNSGSVISIQRTTSEERAGCTYTSTSLVFGIQLNQPQIGERIQQTYLETQLQVIE